MRSIIPLAFNGEAGTLPTGELTGLAIGVNANSGTDPVPTRSAVDSVPSAAASSAVAHGHPLMRSERVQKGRHTGTDHAKHIQWCSAHTILFLALRFGDRHVIGQRAV